VIALQKACGIKHVARATAAVSAEAAIDDAWIDAVHAGIIADGRAEADIVVSVRDAAGAEVAEVVAVYSLRAR
jgi:hypothetical protein